MHILLIQQKKSSIDGEKFAFTYAIETLHGESVENLSFGVTLMSDHLLVYLQLENFRYFQRPLNEVQQIFTNFTNPSSLIHALHLKDRSVRYLHFLHEVFNVIFDSVLVKHTYFYLM